MNEFLVLLQAKLDEAKSKGLINSDIASLQGRLDKLKLQVELDPNTAQKLANDIGKLINQQITISNINIDTNQVIRSAQQTGQQIGNALNQGVENSVKKATNTLKSFSELKIGTGNINAVFNENGLLDVEKSLDRIKEKYSEFGQVKITDKLFDSEGNLQQFRVNIQQLNGDLKESRSFMMALASSGKSFGFPEDVIKGSESYVHHLNDAKKATNEVLTEEEKLANIMADVREKTEQTRQSEEKRQQLAQSNAINKSLEQEYLQRQKISEQLSSKVNKIQLSMETGGYESKVESLIAKTQQWTDANGNARISTTALSTALTNLGDASKALSNNNTVENQKALIAAEKELDTQIKKVTNSVRIMNTDLAKDTAVASLHSRVEEFMSKNGKAVKYFGNELKKILNETSQGAEVSKTKLAQLEQSFGNIGVAARNAGKPGKTFFQTLREGMSSFSYWTSSTFLVMKAIQSIKGGLGTIKALDDALVDLKKTTTATNQQLEDFYYKANKIAKQLGATTQEVIQATADWSRLGYSINEAMSLAETTTVLKSISPGMSMDTATETIVSTIKAYGIEAEDALDGVASKINIIGNNLALSNNDISEILKRSASAMNAANTSLEKTISLGAAAQAIVQDSAVVGTALKSVSTRIRGIDEETQQLSDDLVNIKGDIYDLTNQKVRIMIDNDTYKDIYTILDEISQIWDELSDKQHADLLSKLFGTRQTNVGAAILSNFDDARKAMDLMTDSAGNAMKEMDVIYSSMDYKLGRLRETATSVAQNIFKRNDAKTVVDGLTSVMNVIDSLTSKLGLFGSIGLGAGIFAGVKNAGKPYECMGFKSFVFCFEYALHA